MRHGKAGLRLSRTSVHRKALFANLVAALFTNERIHTTDAKAKETRRLAERTITWARRLGDVLGKRPERRTPEESARFVHAVRMARRVVRDRKAVLRLFNELAPRYLDRRGGYTRIVKTGERPGDAAPMSLLELIPGDVVDVAAKEPAKGKTKVPAAGATKGDAPKGEKKLREREPSGEGKKARGERLQSRQAKKKGSSDVQVGGDHGDLKTG